MTPKITVSKLTANQQKIVTDLVSEFETLNKQEKKEQNNLIDFVEHALSERKRIREEISRENELTKKKHIEFLNSLVKDLQPLADRFGVKLEVGQDLGNIMNISVAYLASNKEAKKYSTIKMRVNYVTIEDRNKYGKMDGLWYCDRSDEHIVVTRETLPKVFAEHIVKFRKSINYLY